ncbi:hypothetical protein QTP86_032136 [Hemibagrus guttatus]|nr:hypothetical protein QTP86_032136 [Hemibagrus guttatus]
MDKSPTVPTTSAPTQTSPTSNGSAEVHVSLVFNSSSADLNASAVLAAFEALLNNTLKNITDPVTVLNITYYDKRLNKTAEAPLEPTTSNFTISEDKVNGYMQYNMPNVPNQPETVPTTSAPTQTSPTSNGSAEVHVSLVFNSSSADLNASAVLAAFEALLNNTLKNITDPKFQTPPSSNITFNISDISIPTNPELWNETYSEVKSIINNVINELLNKTAEGPLAPTTSNFTISEDKVNGYMQYNIPNIPNQPETDKSPTVPTTSAPTQTSPTRISEDKVNGYMQYNMPNVPNQPETEISNTSYAVNITFNISDISIPTNPELWNETYSEVQSIINNVINELLNKTAEGPLAPTTSNFTISEDKVNGYMQYNIPNIPNQPETDKSPTVPTTSVSTQTSPTSKGSAEVQTRLVFNLSSPVTSESEVLGAFKFLLNDTLKNITDPITVLNITYEVNITFSISDISIPTNPELWSDTFTKVEGIINNTINELLNKTAEGPLAPTTSNFTISEDKVNGYMQYNIQSIPNQPGTGRLHHSLITLLSEAMYKSPTVPTISAPTQTSPTSNGSAEVHVSLVFNSSSADLNASAVLAAFEALLNNTLKNITDPVTVLNITYYEISNTSYAVNITFNISDISIPTNPELWNETYSEVQSIINNVINELLNKTAEGPLAPTTSNFTISEDKVNGYMQYNIPNIPNQPETDKSPTVPTTSVSTQTSPTSKGSAEVQTRLVFNLSSPVTSESEVLGAFKFLLNDTLKNITDPITVLNITYEEISNTSYAVNITFSISDISIPTNPELWSDTFTKVEGIINNTVSEHHHVFSKYCSLWEAQCWAITFVSRVNIKSEISDFSPQINELLNKTAEGPLAPTTSNFTISEDKVNGYMQYNIQSIPNQPGDCWTGAKNCSFLDKSPTVPTISAPTQTSPTSNGSAEVHVSLVFNSSSADLNASAVLAAFEALLNNTLKNITDPVKVLNITYYGTKNALNKTAEAPLEPTTSNFTISEDKVNGYMQYNIQSVPNQPGTVTSYVLSHFRIGTALIYIKLIFQNLNNVPSKSTVLTAANEKLESKFRRERDTATQKLEQPVSIHDIVYNKMADNSFSLDLAFKIANVNFSAQCDTELNNNTYKLIQNEINSLMNTILTNPQTPPFNFTQANFTCNGTAAVIVADVIYVYKEADIQSPSLFLFEILKESGLLYYTLPPLVTIQPQTSGNSTYTGAAWILGFVIPCGIVIILLPCWILLCCLLCGCCARIRRRWRRRQSYNVQYQTHSSLF